MLHPHLRKIQPHLRMMLTFSRKHAFWAHTVASGKTVACTGNHPPVANDTLIIWNGWKCKSKWVIWKLQRKNWFFPCQTSSHLEDFELPECSLQTLLIMDVKISFVQVVSCAVQAVLSYISVHCSAWWTANIRKMLWKLLKDCSDVPVIVIIFSFQKDSL